MLNNSFYIIGVVVDTEKNDKYSLIRLEVEKNGSFFGKTFEVVVQVLSGNNQIDLSKDYIGHKVIVNGYIDAKTSSEGALFTNLIAQRLGVLDNDKEIDSAYA